jgi:plastocyanin
MMKIAVKFLFMVSLLSILSANASAATANVSIRDSFFSPDRITVNLGDTVTWTNDGFLPHTSTSGISSVPDGKWDSGVLSSGQFFSYTVTQTGTINYFCATHGFTGTIVVNPSDSPVAPAPSGPQIITYAPVVSSVVNANPALAKPLAIGPLAEEGATINLQVALPQYQVPVDIYVILLSPTLDPNTIFNITPALGLQSISIQPFLQAAAAGVPLAGMAPWMAGVTEPVNSTLFADVPASALSPGDYSFFVLVTLPNNLFNFDLFETDFAIGVPFAETLSGGQEVPPVAAAATATAFLGADFVSGSVAGTMTFSGLTSNATAAHIHNAAAGSNGPILIPFTGGAGATSGIWFISGTLTTPQLAALRAGLLYANIHSENFPSGEIRAQITFPNLNLRAVMSGNKEAPAVATSAVGDVDFLVNINTGELTGTVTFSGLSSNATAAHIHVGAAGVNGGIIIPLAGGAGGTSGTWSVPAGTVLTAAQLTDLSNDQLYVNVHSVNFGGGEIRSQLFYPQRAPTP